MAAARKQAQTLAPAPASGLVEHCLELLSVAGEARARSMFGGHGIRVDGIFVALVAFDRLYLKVDEATRSQFAEAGCEPFVYAGKGKPVTMSYWTVPPQAMDSPESMAPWARLALDAALRASVSRGRTKTSKAAAKPSASAVPSPAKRARRRG